MRYLNNLRLTSRLAGPLMILFFLAGTASAQTVYKVAPKASTVTYHMDHPMHSWDGVSHSATGAVSLADDGKPVSVQITIPVQSFDSGNGSRDSHMAETTESYIYKNVTFKSTSITPGATSGGTQVWNVTGTLTFHGVTKPVSAVTRVTMEGGKLHAIGDFDLTLTEFGIKLPKLMMVPVKDHLGMKFDVVAAS